jgi:hypothetical protein
VDMSTFVLGCNLKGFNRSLFLPVHRLSCARHCHRRNICATIAFTSDLVHCLGVGMLIEEMFGVQVVGIVGLSTSRLSQATLQRRMEVLSSESTSIRSCSHKLPRVLWQAACRVLLAK